jgi:hypothetical protein
MAVCRISLGAAALVLAASATICHGERADFYEVDKVLSVSTLSAAPARNVDQISFRAFHDRLARYGQWMSDPRWGVVWLPRVPDFSPYRQGHWEITQGYGTVWVSDYIWGDIPFHYGRWFHARARGWVWVPGYVWGPAWVIWRAGDGKVGWLPMPPWIDFDGVGAFPDDWTDRYGYADYGYSDAKFFSLWCFVDAGDLYAPSIDYYVIGPGYNGRFIARTVGWTRYTIDHGHVVNYSIEPGRFRASFGLRLPAHSRHDLDGRMGPITDYDVGRRIEAREHGVIGHSIAAGGTMAQIHVPPSTAITHPRVESDARSAPGLRPSEATPGGRMVLMSSSPSHSRPRVYTHTEVVHYSGGALSGSGDSGSQLTLPLHGLAPSVANPVLAPPTMRRPVGGSGASHPRAALPHGSPS